MNPTLVLRIRAMLLGPRAEILLPRFPPQRYHFPAMISDGANTLTEPWPERSRRNAGNRLLTDSSGNVSDQRGTYPFGETWYSPSGAPWMFSTYYRDTERNVDRFAIAPENDYALARSYVNRLARFTSLDPLAGSLANPQSLNRYSYVLNNPQNATDKSGQNCVWDDGSYDAQDDPNTGAQPLCEQLGGTWYDGTMGGDWSANPDPFWADMAQTYGQQGLTIPVLTNSGSVDLSLQGTILGQMLDPNQCANCMSVLYTAGSVVETMGYIEIGGAALVTGGWALDALPVGGELAPTLETATEYANALGIQDNIVLVPELPGQISGMTLQGDIALSQQAFTSEQELVTTLSEESMHLSQQAAMGVPEAGVGTVSPLETNAKAFADLIWVLFNNSGGLP